MDELKTQNAFVPAPEAGIKFSDGSDGFVWKTDPVPSPAVCQLDEVEAILSSKQDETVYKMTLKGSGVDVSIKLTPKKGVESGKVELEGNENNPNNLRSDSTGEKCSQSGTYEVCYSYTEGDSTTGTLTITTSITDNSPLTCEFSEIYDDESTVIDSQYLSKKEFGLSLVGTSVADHSAEDYQIMKDEFSCIVQGSVFKSAKIGCGGDDTIDSEALQENCQDILGETSTGSCKFVMSEKLLKIISFGIQRENIRFYECALGSQLKNGACELCGIGEYRGKESSVCKQCSTSQYAPNRGTTECYSCKNGHVDDEKQTCNPCSPGKKASITGGCEECSAGKYFDETEAECRDCESYKYSLPGFTECYFCQDGYQVTDVKSGCSACPPGHYNDKPQESKCKPCEGDELTTILHGQTICNVTIVKEKFCPKDEKFSTPAVGVISFPSVQAGQESRGPCFHNNDSAAVRLCNVDGQWKRPDLSACNSKQSGAIKKIEVETEAGIENLNQQTTKTEDIAPRDIETVVGKMTDEKVNTVFASVTGDEIEQLATKSMTVVSNMMAASKASPTEQKLKNNIVNCFEHIAMLSLEHMKIGEDSVSFTTDTTDVFLVQNAGDANTTIGDTRIHINVNQSSNIKNLAALIYKDNSAFQPPPNSTRCTSSIAGKVVGLKHTKRDVDTSDNSISFKMKYDVEDLNSPTTKSRQKVIKQCKYYEPETNTWSDTGCTTKVTEDGSVECECDHMTSFAVIMSVQENKSPMWLSNLVLGINITFCLLTLLCTLPFRTFRVRKMTIIQSHSILSLLLLCVTWFIMQDLELSNEKPAYLNMKCKVLAFIAQYFLIATFSWIFCCSLTLKSQIVDAVKSFGKKNKNLVKKCVLFGYGFPLLIPSLAILMDFLMKKNAPGADVQYIRKLECWYEDVWLYSLILFPIYVFFIINIVINIKIMGVVSNARRSSDRGSERRVVKAGFALAFTQGLPWIALSVPGIIPSEITAEVFQYLFLITFGFQGIGLFVFNVLFQEEVLKNLCGLLNVQPPLIFLSVVPSKQRRTPNSQTGETSLGTARNSTANNDKCYSNNLATYYEDESECVEESEGEGSTGNYRSKVEHINFKSTLTSVAAAGDKSLYQDTSLYNELHETSLITEHRLEDNTYTHLNAIKTREQDGSKAETLGPPPSSPRIVKFVAGTRAYGVAGEGSRSPIPGETEGLEHQGPPLM